MASLRELQDSFAAALRDPAAVCSVLPPANLGVYRNNAGFTYHDTLTRTFPVVRRRVGADFFRQLAALYRARFPSRSGDLHGFGRHFAAFLEAYLEDDAYAWLTDLARLEWLRAESSVSGILPAIGVESLGRFAPEELEALEFRLQPSLRLHSSSYPVYTVWLANQVENAPPVDQSLPGESGVTLLRDDGTQVLRLHARLFSFLLALHDQATLGEAMTAAGFDEHELLDALTFLFREGLVSSVSVRSKARLVTSS